MECDEYLNSLTNDTELLVSTEKQFEKLAIYFCGKRYLCVKNMLCSLDLGVFLKSTYWSVEKVNDIWDSSDIIFKCHYCLSYGGDFNM